MTSIARSFERSALTPSATMLSASMSRPESVSSSTHSVGSSSAICRISERFFSPPEKPTLTGRFSISMSMLSLPALSLHELHELGRRQLRLPALLAQRIGRRAQERQAGDARDLHRVLEGEEHALGGALVGLHLEDAFAVPEDVALGHLVVVAAGEHVGERRLARAVRPHDGVHLALGHGER